jgi:hypothetical protein
VLGLGAVDDYRQGNFAVEGYRVAGRIGNMFGNPNDMALHLLTVMPIAVGLMLSTRGVFRKALYATCVVFTILGSIVTFRVELFSDSSASSACLHGRSDVAIVF